MDERIYREIFHTVDIPALITDENYLITDINESGLEFTGYREEEILGEHVAKVAVNQEKIAEILDVVSDGEPWSGDFRVRTKSGDEVYGRGSAAPFEVSGQVGFFAMFVDLTKQRHYENTVKVLNRVLRHDLRNKLTVLYGRLHNISRENLDESDLEDLQTGINISQGIIKISERARDLQKLLRNSFEAENQPVRVDYAINEAFSRVINTYDHATFRLDGKREVTVIADELLPNALEEIFENAVVHNDKETPKVTVNVAEQDEKVLISIADNGPGIPESRRDVIFGREERDQLHHGSGIGLFFVDNVVSSYGGDIWVEDSDFEGAVFKIRLEKA